MWRALSVIRDMERDGGGFANTVYHAIHFLIIVNYMKMKYTAMSACTVAIKPLEISCHLHYYS